MAHSPDRARGDPPSLIRPVTDDRIVSAMRFAEARPDVFPTTSALAKAVGLSQFHFVRLFRDQVGETVSDYIRRIRLDAAAMRLRWTSEPVVSIALSVGYGSQAAFTRAFTARFHVSPAQYRRSADTWFHPIDERSPRDVAVRRVGSLSCLGRRYLGHRDRAPERWADFLGRLPAALRLGTGQRYVSISHDDPRITPIDQLRHDCCIVLPASIEIEADAAAASGLQPVRTAASMYAAATHAGAYEAIGTTYGLILDRWLRTQARYHVRGEVGALEFHMAPPDRDVSQTVLCEVLMPAYAHGAPDTDW